MYNQMGYHAKKTAKLLGNDACIMSFCLIDPYWRDEKAYSFKFFYLSDD
jgi:hypothetical protein